VTFTQTGTYYWQATYSGDSNNNGATSTCTSETVTVTALSPTISTTLSATTIPVDTLAHDTATLSGATPDASGTVTYQIYTENTCTDLATTQISGQPAAVTVTDGNVPDSAAVTFTQTGTYYWQATYSGDSNNTGPVHSSCTSEAVVVSPNAPSIVTQTVPGSPVAIGTSAYDTATLTGATSNAGGTVTYGLYSDSSCSTQVANLTPDDNAVSGGVVPNSNSHIFTSAGTWYFQATYSGDGNNLAAVSVCGNELLTVSPTLTPAGSVSGITSNATPAGGVLGITTPSTGAGATAGGWGWLGLILVLLGGAFLVAQRLVRRAKIKIENI
jgi:hypothetical protein